jgi:hypothetical protein
MQFKVFEKLRRDWLNFRRWSHIEKRLPGMADYHKRDRFMCGVREVLRRMEGADRNLLHSYYNAGWHRRRVPMRFEMRVSRLEKIRRDWSALRSWLDLFVWKVRDFLKRVRQNLMR